MQAIKERDFARNELSKSKHINQTQAASLHDLHLNFIALAANPNSSHLLSESLAVNRSQQLQLTDTIVQLKDARVSVTSLINQLKTSITQTASSIESHKDMQASLRTRSTALVNATAALYNMDQTITHLQAIIHALKGTSSSNESTVDQLKTLINQQYDANATMSADCNTAGAAFNDTRATIANLCIANATLKTSLDKAAIKHANTVHLTSTYLLDSAKQPETPACPQQLSAILYSIMHSSTITVPETISEWGKNNLIIR